MSQARRQRTTSAISRNLDMLERRHGLDAQTVAIRAGVGIRTYARIKAGNNTTYETLRPIAGVFGLTEWHLLSPTLAADLDNQEWLDRIRSIFATAPQEGVKLLQDAIRAAETIAAVHKTGR